MTTIAATTGAVTVGVDTHKDIHVAAVLDEVGRLLGSCGFPTDPAGNAALIGRVEQHGSITGVGVEGTGSYGAQLTRDLQRAGHHVIEVDRPDRKARRLRGKDDHLDAEAAARAVLSGRATTVPKARDGQIEAIRALRVARRSCVTGRTVAMNQLKALLVSAPQDLREQLRGLSSTQLIKTAARLRPADDLADPLNATTYAMREIGLRHQFLTEQLTRLDATLRPLVAAAAPALAARHAVGTDTRRRAARGRGRQPGPAGQRELLRAPVRRRTAAGLQRQDQRPLSPQPRGRPPSQQRPLADRAGPHGHRAANQGLRRQTNHPR